MLCSEMYSELDNYLRDLPNNRLVILCNEIYERKYEVGELPEKSVFDSLYKKFNLLDRRLIQNYITKEALRRYRRLSLLLIKESPAHFLQQ